MSYVKGLRCTECGTEYPVEARAYCDRDLAGVEVVYDYDAMRVTRKSIEAGPRSLWRYRDLLPIDGEPRAGLRSGFTPLIKADRLAKALGVRELYIKDDSVNQPTFSYKDRVVAVALTRALEFGYKTVACASTGNLAHSLAAHAASAGVPAVVLIPHDLEAGKVVGTYVFGPSIIRVRGNYDDVNRLCTLIADRVGWAVINVNLRPFYTEGAKTHGWEIAEQLGWKLPQHTVVPVAGGTILPKIWKAYGETRRLGLVEDNQPRIYSAQAEGCSPIAKAICTGSEWFDPVKPNTIARSIAIGNPADGGAALHAIRESGGWAAAASDDEIIAAIRLLARTEGIFTEPAGGTTLAAAIKLIKSGRIPADESICVCITGNGLKSIEAVHEGVDEIPVIGPKIGDLEALLGGVGVGQRTEALGAVG
ncbi:MAG: threonine synthase [Candidatus Xenobia bacterium]